MNVQPVLFLVILGFGAAALLAFLIEWLLLSRVRFPITCFLAGLCISLISVAIIIRWISANPDPLSWETIVGDDPWSLALSRVIILSIANSCGPILILYSFGLRKLEHKDQDASNRSTAPRSVRKQWN
jgi:hypothetical protein